MREGGGWRVGSGRGFWRQLSRSQSGGVSGRPRFYYTVPQNPSRFLTGSTTHLPRCWSWKTTRGGHVPCTPRRRWRREGGSWAPRVASPAGTARPTGALTRAGASPTRQWVPLCLYFIGTTLYLHVGTVNGVGRICRDDKKNNNKQNTNDFFQAIYNKNKKNTKKKENKY